MDFEHRKSKICTLIQVNVQNKLTLCVSCCVLIYPFPSFSGVLNSVPSFIRQNLSRLMKEGTEIQNVGQKTTNIPDNLGVHGFTSLTVMTA